MENDKQRLKKHLDDSLDNTNKSHQNLGLTFFPSNNPFTHEVDWDKIRNFEDLKLVLSCLNMTFDLSKIGSKVVGLLKPIREQGDLINENGDINCEGDLSITASSKVDPAVEELENAQKSSGESDLVSLLSKSGTSCKSSLAISDASQSDITITSIKDDPGLTDDPKDERINKHKDGDPTKQNKAYLVLSDEERAKGFVRPVRRSYIHVGKDIDLSKMRKLHVSEIAKYKKFGYVGFIPNEDEESAIAGTFVIERDLKPCKGFTTMSLAIAETYARDPKFYGSTWCCACSGYHPVAEFVWADTDERLGS